MDGMEKNIHWVLLLVITIVCFSVQVSAVTVSELQGLIAEERGQVPETGRFVYVEESVDNSAIEGDPNSIVYLLSKIRSHCWTQNDILLDIKRNRARISKKDISDKSEFEEEYRKLAEQGYGLSGDGTIIYQGDYTLIVTQSETGSTPDLSINMRPAGAGLPNHKGKLYSGLLIAESVLANAIEADISAVEADGKSLLRVKIHTEKEGKLLNIQVIDLDPLLGFRFRHYELKGPNGQLAREIIADDYRDVNGIPYPFLYIRRQFDENGKVVKEKKYTFETVELGVDVSEDDFKVAVPAGTNVTDVAMTMRSFTINKGGTMSIGDVLELANQQE